MQIDVFLRRAQEVQESVMIDRVEIGRPGAKVYDKTKMAKVDGPLEVFWTGPGLVQSVKNQPALVPSGGQQVTLQPYKGKVPIAVEVESGMVLKVLESADPWLVGRSFTIGLVYGSSMATCRYFDLEDRDNDGR